jgi:hypothetical protein
MATVAFLWILSFLVYVITDIGYKLKYLARFAKINLVWM